MSKAAITPQPLLLPFKPIESFKVATQKESDAAYSKGGRAYYKVPIDKVILREGFNVREDMGDIVGLANSILINGQITACKGDPLNDGKFLIAEGERRYRAVAMLHEWGHKHITLKCEALEKSITDIERIKLMFISQDNKQLTENEVCRCFKLLVDNGWTQKKIAEDLGKTPAYVNQMLKYNTESQEVKDLVAKGVLSAHSVVKLQGKIPDQQKRTHAIVTAVTRKTTLVKQLPKAKAPADDDEEILVEDPETQEGGSTLEAGEGVDRHANYKSSGKKEIDTIENSSGPAMVTQFFKDGSEQQVSATVSVNDVMGKKTKRQRINLLVAALDEKFTLSLDDAGKKDLFDMLTEYL